jgi:hypothetical protein
MRIILLILCVGLLATVAQAQVTCMSCDCNPALCDPVKPPPTTDRPGKKPKKSTTTTSTVRGKGTVK